MVPELPISSEDWGNTPPAVQAFVMTLWERVQARPTPHASPIELLIHNDWTEQWAASPKHNHTYRPAIRRCMP